MSDTLKPTLRGKPAFKTFIVRGSRGEPVVDHPVDYIPIRVAFAGKKQELALHHWIASWQVSDPESGARVLVLQGFYRGIRCGSGSFTPTEARREAVAQVQALIERVGEEKFWETIERARSRARCYAVNPVEEQA